MVFTKVFRKKIRAVQVRCGLNLLLQQTGRILAAAGVVAALAVLVQRLLALVILTPVALWAFWGVLAGVVLLLWLPRLPSRMQASLSLDERLGLRGHFPVGLSRSRCYWAGTWLVAVGLALYLPRKDLLLGLMGTGHQE